MRQPQADFEGQISAMLGAPRLEVEAHARATEQVVSLILRGCGLL
ncbi:MAG: TetR family transcriptional regulator C-terminal domain-containing protein [Polaromonas sp.]